MLTEEEVKQALQDEIFAKRTSLSREEDTLKHSGELGVIRGLTLAIGIIEKLDPDRRNC